jgi:mandelamide amidase
MSRPFVRPQGEAQPEGRLEMQRRQFLGVAAAAALGQHATAFAAPHGAPASTLSDLGVAAAARAIQRGEVSSEAYATTLLERARNHADLKSFITIDEAAVLEAAREADRKVRAGKRAPLLGVPLGVKDSYLTQGMTTTFGTSVLNSYKPTRDAAAVAGLKGAGALVFGKNNLAEMSWGLTGLNAHHGQVKNPYRPEHVTGGSSSGAGASVAARIVPAALGGDTVGSIRVPASLCGVVGYKPTIGRWPTAGVAPISHTLDVTGILARSVEDCDLIDGVLTKAPARQIAKHAGLTGIRLAYAPRQHLANMDGEVEAAFREALRALRAAGAKIEEVDLGDDFFALSDRTTWPIFFHETMPAIREFVVAERVPATFAEIYAGLGTPFNGRWSRVVVPTGPGYVSDEQYAQVLKVERQELRRRLNAVVGRFDALIFPTTPCVAPAIENQWKYRVAGKDVTDIFLSRHTHPGSTAGLPGISLPMGLNSQGLPIGLEMDGAVGADRALLATAMRVERVLAPIPAPAVR